jgi:hypothetical protein
MTKIDKLKLQRLAQEAIDDRKLSGNTALLRRQRNSKLDEANRQAEAARLAKLSMIKKFVMAQPTRPRGTTGLMSKIDKLN